MAVNLGKSSVSTNSTSIQNQSNSVKDPVELLKNQVGFKVFDGYCDQNTFNSLIQYGVQSCGLSDKKCEVILGVEFENKNIVTNQKFSIQNFKKRLNSDTCLITLLSSLNVQWLDVRVVGRIIEKILQNVMMKTSSNTQWHT